MAVTFVRTIMRMQIQNCLKYFLQFMAAPAAQWIKQWPTDLEDLGSNPACGGTPYNYRLGSIAHSLSLSSSHRPGKTKILLNRCKIISHPSILQVKKTCIHENLHFTINELYLRKIGYTLLQYNYRIYLAIRQDFPSLETLQITKSVLRNFALI